MRRVAESDAVIAIVDDDPSVREGLQQADPVCGVEGRDLCLRAGIPGPSRRRGAKLSGVGPATAGV